MIFSSNYLNTSLIIIGLILFVGCATMGYGKLLGDESIIIERKASSYGVIGLVSVYQQETGSFIRGEVQNRLSSRGRIPGHVDIELINADGKTVFQDTANYRRPNIKSRRAKFTAKFAQSIKNGSRLRITHHVKSHGDDSTIER